MAKHSALTRANGVRFPGDLRPPDPESVNGRPLRSERRYPRSSRGSGTAIGDRLMAGRQPLKLLVEVRILVPEPTTTKLRAAWRRPGELSDNRIVDDARGRAPPRPRRCPCSRSGDGASLKRRRCWFDSRRGHIDCGTLGRVPHLPRWAPRGEASLRPRDRGTPSVPKRLSDNGPIGDGYQPVTLCAPTSGWSSGR